MNPHAGSHKEQQGEPFAQLVGQMLASYCSWRRNATTVGHVHRRWCDAPCGDEARWYSRYLAALDQEEAAAIVYELAAWDLEGWLQRAGWAPPGPLAVVG